MQQKDFIITSLQSWDIEIGSTIKNMALEISKKNRVLYINTPLDHITWLRGNKTSSDIRRMNVISGKEPSIREINKNLWVIDCPFLVYSVNKLPTSRLFDRFNRMNNKKIANRILEAAHAFYFNNYIHIIDTDIYRSFYLKELINPALSVYYCRDYVIGQAYWKKNGTRLEPLLAKKSDLVITNSTRFAERFIQYNPYTYPVETGVNLTLYDVRKDRPLPEDLKSAPHPVIGYVGSIDSTRLDSDLLLKIARQRPDYQFVFVGPEDNHFRHHPLHQLENVTFLGKKPVDLLPSYIRGFDVCINPQSVNEITDGNYPLKIDEYLAMGKPVVATDTHTMRDIFSQHTLLARSAEEYTEQIDKALVEANDETKKEERISFAHSHSWGHSIEKIYRIIDAFEKPHR